MPASTISTLARGTSPESLVSETVAQLETVGALRGGVVFATGGLGHAALAARLAQALPGVEWMGVTALGSEPALAGFWLTGEVRAAVAAGARGRALAETAVARGGLKAFQTRLALLAAGSGEPLLGELFEVLPKGAAFLGADATEVWTAQGRADAALLVADWQPRLTVGFEGAELALARSGIAPSSVVGLLRLHTGALDPLPATLPAAPQAVAQVHRLFGVPDRSPASPATATLVLSDLKDRAEG